MRVTDPIRGSPGFQGSVTLQKIFRDVLLHM